MDLSRLAQAGTGIRFIPSADIFYVPLVARYFRNSWHPIRLILRKDENNEVRHASALALLRIESEKAVESLTEALNDEDWGVRFYADEALKAIQKKSTQP